MSGYKGHITGAIVANTAFLIGVAALPGEILTKNGIMLKDWQLLIGLFVIAILFGLWPDVDTNSVGQNIFFAIAFIADVILIANGKFEPAAYLGLLAMTPIIGKHRGWTHSRITMLLLPLPIVLVPYLNNHRVLPYSLLIYGAAVTGYFSHLLLDGRITRNVRFKGHR